MTDIDTDALPIHSCIDARLSEHRGSINRLSDEELRERHPRYPRTAYGEPLEPKDLIHFVFVYANKDYHKFTEFYEWFKEIKSTIKDGHTVKCNDRESELFPRNHDDNINEICERAIFILPFLFKSFCDDEVLRFFTSEAIGTTRLDQTSAQGSLENVLKKQKRCAVRPIHTEPSTNRKYTTPAGLRMMEPINYYNKNEDSVKKVVGGIIEESIKRFEERKTAMENALTGTDGPSPMKPCIENSLVDGTNALSLAQDGYCAPEEKVGNVGMGEDLTLPTDGSSSLTSNALSDTPGNKQLNYAAALTNGGKKMSQTSKTAEGNMGHLSAEGRNFSDNEKYGNNPATTQFDASLETDNGSISKNTIQNAAENTVNGQKSTQTAESETSWKNLSLTESYSETKAKKMTTKAKSLICATHPFSKGTHKQKDAIESIGKHYVSRSVGLIRIKDRLSGTGFRVGSKYVATCYHIIKEIITVSPHFIDSDQLSMEFGKYKNAGTGITDQNQVFGFERTIAYTNEEYDFVVLELKGPNTNTELPPPLTCFGGLIDSEIHLLGHPGGEQMKEDSEVFPVWSPKHDVKIISQIKKLGFWSLTNLPEVNSEPVDYYSDLLKLPRKILFHTTFDEGSSGSPGFEIKDNNAWVILMLSGGAPGCFYKDNFNRKRWPLEDNQKVEYGYAMVDIYEKMIISKKELALDIFREWKK